jgi:hypothetical protein
VIIFVILQAGVINMPKKIALHRDELNQLMVDYGSGQTLRQLEIKYPYGRRALSKLLKEAGVNIRDNTENSRRYYHDEDYFEIIDTPEKAYWLGFIYADGFIESKRAGFGNQKLGITIAECDADHLDKFKQCISSTNPIKVYPNRLKTPSFSYGDIRQYRGTHGNSRLGRTCKTE